MKNDSDGNYTQLLWLPQSKDLLVQPNAALIDKYNVEAGPTQISAGEKNKSRNQAGSGTEWGSQEDALHELEMLEKLRELGTKPGEATLATEDDEAVQALATRPGTQKGATKKKGLEVGQRHEKKVRKTNNKPHVNTSHNDLLPNE
jgi:hypothetical protein